jgi:hypothetical protein
MQTEILAKERDDSVFVDSMSQSTAAHRANP